MRATHVERVFLVGVPQIDRLMAATFTGPWRNVGAMIIDPVFPLSTTTISLADITILPDCRTDLLNIGDLMARGWCVIPLKPRKKVPAVRWEAYQHRLPTLAAWFKVPGFNVGMFTNIISKIFLVDLDNEAGWHSGASVLGSRTGA